MPTLEIIHCTTYRYQRHVSLGPHRLILRPRESRDLRLHSFELQVTPDATVSWANDVAGNFVATATFSGTAEQLVIRSAARLELTAERWPVFDIGVSAISYPFRYSDDDWADLGSLAVPAYVDDIGRLRSWVYAFVSGSSTDTLSLLRDVNEGVANAISYESRDDEGTQGPLNTLGRAVGSCRDLATLFVEAVRTLGFGARIVSGYIHDPDLQAVGSAGAGSTHAWAEVFVPGAGWIAFDPTNRSVGGSNLIPVAKVRDIRQAMPVSGSFSGPPDSLKEMSVSVTVREMV